MTTIICAPRIVWTLIHMYLCAEAIHLIQPNSPWTYPIYVVQKCSTVQNAQRKLSIRKQITYFQVRRLSGNRKSTLNCIIFKAYLCRSLVEKTIVAVGASKAPRDYQTNQGSKFWKLLHNVKEYRMFAVINIHVLNFYL